MERSGGSLGRQRGWNGDSQKVSSQAGKFLIRAAAGVFKWPSLAVVTDGPTLHEEEKMLRLN